MTEIYAILDTEKGDFISFNSKRAWIRVGAAKNAFGLHMPRLVDERGYPIYQRFDEQTRYKIVELTEYYFMYKQLEK